MKIFIDAERNQYDLDEPKDMEKLVDRIDRDSKVIIDLKAQLNLKLRTIKEEEEQIAKLYKYLTTTINALKERDEGLFLDKILPILEKYVYNEDNKDNEYKKQERIQLAKSILNILCTDSTYTQIKEEFKHNQFDSLKYDFHQDIARIIMFIALITENYPVFMCEELGGFIGLLGKGDMMSFVKNIRKMPDDDFRKVLQTFYEFILDNINKIRSECLYLIN